MLPEIPVKDSGLSSVLDRGKMEEAIIPYGLNGVLSCLEKNVTIRNKRGEST